MAMFEHTKQVIVVIYYIIITDAAEKGSNFQKDPQRGEGEIVRKDTTRAAV